MSKDSEAMKLIEGVRATLKSSVELDAVMARALLLGATLGEVAKLLLNYPFGKGVEVCGFDRFDYKDKLGQRMRPKFTLREVPLSLLKVDSGKDGYQRKDKPHIQASIKGNIMHNLADLQCGSRTDSGALVGDPVLWLMDGGQRLGAYLKAGKTTASVIVIPTMDSEDEAAIFLLLDNNQQLSPQDKLPASLMTVPHVAALKRAAAKHGFFIKGDRTDRPVGSQLLKCYGKLEGIWKIDHTVAEEVLRVLSKAHYSDKNQSPIYELLLAVFSLVKHDPANADRIIKRLSTKVQDGSIVDIGSVSSGMSKLVPSLPGCKDNGAKLAWGLADFLNKGCTKDRVRKQKLELRF